MSTPTSRGTAIQDNRPWHGASFDDFYKKEFASILGMALAILRDRSAAEDLAQEAFVSALKNWEKVVGYEAPHAWVRRVMINRATSLRRRLSAEVRALTRFGASSNDQVWLSPESSEVWEEVARLPRRQAQVIVMHYVGGLTVVEIGDVLGCSSGSVKTHLHRARETLEHTLHDWKDGQR